MGELRGMCIKVNPRPSEVYIIGTIPGDPLIIMFPLRKYCGRKMEQNSEDLKCFEHSKPCKQPPWWLCQAGGLSENNYRRTTNLIFTRSLEGFPSKVANEAFLNEERSD